MSKTMLIDAAHAEETRVAIVEARQVEEFDFESRARRQLRGNIYLAKVTRVEPSLQAAFVEYGGNRHGFLAFNEIHPDYYQIPVADREAIMAEAPSDEDEHDDLGRESDDGESEGGLADEERLKRRLMRRYKIQDVIRRRQILLVQVVKDERGAKGAALTTWLSLAGRYCVLMPNTGKGGGISRKITQATDRKRLKAAAAALDVPKGMGLIIRTAGAKRTKAEIKRDYEYLLRLWETIRETTLSSNAPSLIYEEENLVRRAVRDMFDKDFDGIQVEGYEGWKQARDFMRVLMPSQAKKVHLYQGSRPLFAAHGIEDLLTQIHQPTVPLKSGGYLVINQTEALVAIDVNSGRATKERNVEQTAYKTNLEAAVEAARQLRLRDLAGLVVIDFIDMDESKNNRAVEKVMKDALAKDRARIQMGRISDFGLMEISRQRRRLGVIEGATEVCPHCQGAGRIRSAESAALMMLRGVDIEVGKNGAGTVGLKVPLDTALYILNHKRAYLDTMARMRGVVVMVSVDESLAPGEYTIERLTTDPDFVAPEAEALPVDDMPVEDLAFDEAYEDEDEDEDEDFDVASEEDAEDAERAPRERSRSRGPAPETSDDEGEDGGRRRRRGRRGGRRVREDSERDGFNWVRGRTPSLTDPYVWFDPINPHGDTDVAQPGAAQADRPDGHPANDDGENEGEREGNGRRRRRRRGRGRDRAGSEDVSARAEARAASEGMIDEEPVDTAVTALVEGETSVPVTEPVTDATPVEAEPAPKRRRVRRKAVEAAGDQTPVEAGAEADTESSTPVEPEMEAAPEPVVVEASAPPAAEEPVVVSKPAPARKTIDVEEILASDPNQITAPPPKPKRGWWRL
ncbi:ribonuclease E/G [Brevundimonas sp.]|uniref:Rne/Rng family ribonuclease n=1 Tax=Brevundimonas sp. TaxID=1871086 RepID=UPI001D57CECE|nr:ribonuclease E/G [Brevundimonas sp.]MBL0947708.1 Rne/Rng family ribonuclease [Brevundimonas sp.]